MRTRLILIACLLALVPLTFVLAANTSSSLPMAFGRVHLSVDGDSATVDELDTGSRPDKRAAIVNLVVHDRPVVLLVRLQHANNGLFVDVVADATIGEVDTRTGAMSLTARSHPSPTEDAVDTAILAAAAAD